jgi:RNA polymerase sigma factor (sigma-70 family)
MLLNMTACDLDLLRQYTSENSQDAFAEVVRRHLDLVYSAALRQIRSPQLAEEVVQSVFTDLARNSHRLAPDTILSAWLYQVTRRTAIDVVRREARRQLHEQTAAEMNALNATASDWMHIEPLLDEAMHALDETDRTAVLLRYFENKSLRQVGHSLGTSEDAAQKRVSRAVERLREFFAKRGVAVGAGGLVVGISTNAVHAAPVGLFATVTAAAALAGTTLVTTTTATAAKAIAMSTLQKTFVTVTLAAAVGAGIYQAREASHLRDQVQTLQQQQAPLAELAAQLKSDNEILSNRVTQANRSPSLSSERLRELLRLRSEVGILRRQQRELAQAVAAAQSKASGLAVQLVPVAPPQPAKPLPFQVQLVLDEAGENTEPLTNNAGGETLYVQKSPLLDHTAIGSASVEKNALGAPVINVEFSDVGRELFAQITKENLNKRLAIVLNGRLYSAPVIRSEIPGGKAQISGSFTDEEARDLAASLNLAIGVK